MGKVMKALAILVLLVTIAGAGAVLYGLNTLAPVVEQATVLVTPAEQAQPVFDQAMEQLRDETFTGRVYAQADGVSAQDCAFLTYTVRLTNKGFFPAEWLSLEVVPVEGDLLRLDNYSANVLAAGSSGDLSATILHAGSADDTRREFSVTCYVFGQKITLAGSAQ